MKYQPIIRALGLLLILTGAAMIPCAIADITMGEEDWTIFAMTSLGVMGFGGLLTITSGNEQQVTGTREAFLLTVLVWLVLPFASCVPFISMGFSFTDAYFETVSGLTTTGATIMTGLDQEQRGLLLWRSILQWIGGVGIIVTAIAILPMLRIGGMQLFQTESSDVTGKFLPRVGEIATQITLLYVGLTIACGICYALAGMTVFDAINHAMTTMAAGGYSTSDQSIGKYQDARIIEICIVFMTLAAMPFAILVLMVFHGRWMSIFKDPQPRLFVLIVGLTTLALIVYLFISPQATHMRSDPHVGRDVLFSVISVITGTGYAVNDYGQWGSFADIVFVLLMFIGGCAGSAACGMNIFRIEIMAKTMVAFTKRILSPNRVTVVRYNGKPVQEDVLQSVMIFVFLYLFIFSVSSVLLSLTGMDALTAYSSVATALSNVGPGMGERVGPASTFQDISDFAKWVMTINMIFGRLEIMPVFVVLTPRFWRI